MSLYFPILHADFIVPEALSDLKEPHFFTHLVDNVKMKGEETVMSVEIRGIPQPDVKW